MGPFSSVSSKPRRLKVRCFILENPPGHRVFVEDTLRSPRSESPDDWRACLGRYRSILGQRRELEGYTPPAEVARARTAGLDGQRISTPLANA